MFAFPPPALGTFQGGNMLADIREGVFDHAPAHARAVVPAKAGLLAPHHVVAALDNVIRSEVDVHGPIITPGDEQGAFYGKGPVRAGASGRNDFKSAKVSMFVFSNQAKISRQCITI